MTIMVLQLTKFSRFFVRQKCLQKFYMVTDNVFKKNKKRQEKGQKKENMTYIYVSITLHWKECIYPMILFQVFNFHHLVSCFLMDAAYFHGNIMKFPKKGLCNVF